MKDAKLHILVVDDEPRIRQYIRTLLQKGFPDSSIVVAAGPREALDVVARTPVDVIVTDHHMPDGEGRDLLAEVRLMRPGTKRVLLTASPDSRTIDQGLLAGEYHAALLKPFEGAALVDAIARLMDLATESEARAPPAAASAPSRDAPDAAPPTKRLLVVDDLLHVARLIESIAKRLSPHGVEIVVETDPRRAVDRLMVERFDAIVSDYRMPDMTGMELLARARAHDPTVRLILVTGYNEIPETPERVEAARVDAYVHKPLIVQDLLLLLRDALSADPAALATYRAQARVIERAASRRQAPLDLEDA